MGNTASAEVDFLPAPEPLVAKAEITWRLATVADMPALRLLRFQTEAASGRPVYLPEVPSDDRMIVVAEHGGKIVGAAVAEDSVLVTLLGTEAEVAESAGQVVIPQILTSAREEGTRLVQVRMPNDVSVDLSTGVEAGEKVS